MNTAANRLATGGRNNIGAPGVLLGTARLLTCIAEVPAFRMSGKILRALGVSGSFALAQAAYIVRFLWYVNLDKLVKYVNERSGATGVRAQYSTMDTYVAEAHTVPMAKCALSTRLH